MIYHVQYNTGNGWQGISEEFCYEYAEFPEIALESVKCAVADKIQNAERDRITATRAYLSEDVPEWQECYQIAKTYRYRIRTIETDGHGNVTKSDWHEINPIKSN